MALLRVWTRHEVRARWRSLLVLSLLVAFAGATVLTAFAGARRGATAADRLWDRSLATDAVVLLNEPRFDWDAVRQLPGVEAMTTFAVADYVVDEVPAEGADSSLAFPPADAEVWKTIERPVVLDGRLPDPERADEVAVTAGAEEGLGLAVGDTVTVRLFTPAQADESMTGEVGAPEGPVLRARVVGVVRSPWFSDRVDTDGGVIPSPGLFARHPGSFLGATGDGHVNALVRLEGGRAGFDDFRQRIASLTGRSEVDVWDGSETLEHARDVTRFEAACLLAFAVAAALGSVVLIGQALARWCSGSRPALDALRTLGVEDRKARLLGAVPPTVAATLGAAIAVVGAVGLSRWFPIGSAALVEPEPGVDVDLPVLALVLIAPALVLVVALAVSGRLRRGSVRTEGRAWKSAVGSTPLPVSLGLRFALQRHEGARPVPVRPALAGMAIGVAGAVAAVTFAGGLAGATEGYAAFGQTYDLSAFFGFNGESTTDTASAVARWRDDPEVIGVVDARNDIANVSGEPVSLYSHDVIGQFDVVVTDGRMPGGPGEVALAPLSADRLGVSVGDQVDVRGTDGTVRARVTGLALVPTGPHNGYATGGWLSSDGYDALFRGFKFRFALVDLEYGADERAAAERLGESAGVAPQPGPVIPPTEREELRQVRSLPLLLAGFLVLLGAGAVGHTLASMARRRATEFGILRALGMTRPAIRAAITCQATVIGIFGALVGIPLGIVVGRRVWSTVADQAPVVPVQASPWLLVLGVPIVVIALVNLLALHPARSATRRRADAIHRVL
jgi:cell division protein FtsX